MFKRLGLFTVFLVLMFSAIPATLADSDCDFTYSNHARAAQLHDMGDYSSALHHYECALEQDPDNEILRLMISNILDMDRALSDDAISSSPQVPYCETDISHFAAGSQSHAMGDLQAALRAYECALSLNPDSNAVMIQLAQVYTEMALYDDALSYLSLAMNNDPNNIFLLTHRAYIYYLAEDYVAGLADTNVVLRWNPTYANAIEIRDLILSAMREGTESVETAQVPSNSGKNTMPQLDDDFGNNQLVVPATEAEPTSADANTLRMAAQTFVYQTQYELAIEQYEALLGFEPNNADVHMGLAHAHYALENYDISLSYLEQTLSLRSDDLYATYYLAMAHSQLNHRVDAFSIIDDLHVNKRYDSSFPLVMAHVYRALGYDDVAGGQFYEWMTWTEILRLPAELDPQTNSVELLMDYGLVYEVPFSAIAGEYVSISVASHILNTIPIDPLIVVLNQDGVPITGDDDSGDLFDAQLTFIPSSTGDYTLLVSHAGGHHNGELDVSLTGIAWSADTFRMLAQEAFDANNYDRAIDMLNNAIALDGGTVADYAKLARIYKLMGDLDSAAVVLSQALELDPMNADLRCELGIIYETWGDYDSALVQFDMILANIPHQPCAWTNRDGILSEMRTAADTSANAIVVPAAPSPADDLVALAYQYRADNRMFSSANTFLQAVIVDPNHDVARCELGKIYLDWGNYHGAMRHFDYLLAKDSTNECAISNRNATLAKIDSIFVPMTAQDFIDRALMNYEMGNLEAAASAYRTALSLDPLNSVARCHLGIVYSELGDYDGALREWDTVLAQHIVDSCAWSNRDALLARMRDADFINVTAQVSEFEPLDADDFIRQGDEFIRQEDFESAIDAYMSALELDPHRYDIRCVVGMMYLDLNDVDSAITQFNYILSQNLDDHCARNQLRNAMRVLNGDTASAQVSESGELDASDFIRQGDEFIRQEDFESAIDSYLSALELDPHRYDIRCVVGMMYLDLNDVDSAIRQFNYILSQNLGDHCARNQLQNAMQVLNGDTASDSNDIDSLYNELIAQGVHALMSDAQARHEAGDVWTASALLDRYIDNEYAYICVGELRWLSMEYRDQGYTVFADMMLLKAIGDSTC